MRRLHVLTVGVVLAWALSAAGGALASPLDRGNGSDRDAYAVALSPAQPASGTTRTFTVAFTNDPRNTERITGISFTAPRGFHPVHMRGSIKQVGARMFRLGGLNLAPGRTVRISFEATVPIRCHRASYDWRTSAWENDARFPGGREFLALGSRSAPRTSSHRAASRCSTPPWRAESKAARASPEARCISAA